MISNRPSQAWFWRLSVAVGLILFFSGCPRKIDDCTTCPSERLITLSSSRVSCTEAWLKLSVANLEKTRISLEQDGHAFADLTLGVFDTTLYYTGLTPGRTYSFQAIRQPSKDQSDVSEPLTVRTMDTTSHEFTWTVTTLGDGNSSVLNDVAIINDTLAYAVGEIYLKDSIGHFDPNAYNAVQWDGRHLTPVRIPFVGQCAVIPYPPLEAIWANSSTSILVTNGGNMVSFDGSIGTMDCRMNPLLAGAVNKIFATSAADVYVVGNLGTIVHYNGSSWQKIESGTTADFRDIWGQDRVLAVASSRNETKVLAISNHAVHDSLSWPPTNRLIGLWMSPGSTTYVCGSGLWKLETSVWHLMEGVPNNIFYSAVRGNADNDIFITAWNGVLMHFNGTSWHTYTEIPSDYSFYSLAVKQNTIVAVGFTGGLFTDKAAVVIGKRVH